MSSENLQMVLSWAEAEGWNPGLHDAVSFYSAYPHGFFMAFDADGMPIGSISAVAYDNSFGFIGFFIVRNDFRGHHIGIELGQAALKYLGKRCIGQDGVLKKVKNYEHYGFKMAYRNIRFEAITKKMPKAKGLTEISNIQFEEICRYDSLHFPAERKEFLNKWISQPQSLALGMLDTKNHLSGYGVIRKCVKGYKIGPLFANSAEIAEKIFLGLAEFANEGEPFYIDLPDQNKNALALANKYQMKEVFSTARMYMNGIPDLPIDEVYGVTSFELG